MEVYRIPNNVAHIASDRFGLYMFHVSNSRTIVRCIDPFSFEEHYSFPLEIHWSPVITPVIDEDTIYLTTADGLFLVLDKFTGECLGRSTFGTRLPSNGALQTPNSVCFLASVPLITPTPYRADTHHWVILKFSKDDGSLVWQSKTWKGVPPVWTCSSDVYVATGNTFISMNGDVKWEDRMVAKPDFVLSNDENAIVVSKSGVAECWDNEGKKLSKLLVGLTDIPPIMEGKDLVYFSKAGFTQVSIESKKVQTHHKWQMSFIAPIVRQNGNFCSITNKGQIVVASESNMRTYDIEDFNSKSATLAWIGKNLFINSNQNLMIAKGVE